MSLPVVHTMPYVLVHGMSPHDAHNLGYRRAAPDITIEIRWCPAHEGVEGNEKADEWAKLAADEPDTQGVEGWTYSDRPEETPLPKSLANIRREISEKKWMEA